MEHNPYITLNDETEITYSDIKIDNKGREYVTVYFETPTDNGFSSMDINTNDDILRHVQGYNVKEMNIMLDHYRRIKNLCIKFAAEDKKELKNA